MDDGFRDFHDPEAASRAAEIKFGFQVNNSQR
jgi:hypothetical protein